MNAIAYLHERLPPACFTDHCQRDGHSVSLTDAPSPHVVVDVNSSSLDISNDKSCDFLFFSEVGPRLYVAAIEMKRVSPGGVEFCERLQAGADLADGWLPELQECEFVPILAHKGVPIMAERYRRLYRPVHFRGERVMPLVTRYGNPLTASLPGGTVAEHSVTADELPEQLKRFIVSRSGEDMVGIAEAASQLGVSRATIYDWAAKNTLIAWRSGQRGLNIPATQIVDGKVVPGLAEVVDVVGSPQLAWAFLDQKWPFEDVVERPLERLNSGHLDEVLDAAVGFGATFT